MAAQLGNTLSAAALAAVGAVVIRTSPFPHSLAVGIFCTFVAGAMWQAGLGRRK